MLFLCWLLNSYKEKLRGYGETDCVIMGPQGTDGDIFGILKPYEWWGSHEAEVFGVDLSAMENERKDAWNVLCLLSAVRLLTREGSAVLEFGSMGYFANKEGLKVAPKHLWRSRDMHFGSY